MNLKRRLERVEQDVVQECQAAEQAKRQRDREWCTAMHLPLPAEATQAEKDEALKRLLLLQAKARAGTATDADLVEWFTWVDSVHWKHGCRPPM